MSRKVAKEELNSLTEIQKELHVLLPNDGQKGEILTIFHQSFRKCTWYSMMTVKLRANSEGDEIVYTADPGFHLLVYTYMRSILPAIRVKDKYKDKVRICWPHNIGTNITSSAYFKDDFHTYGSIDHTWEDMYFQYMQSQGAGKRKNHKVGVGNMRYLERWSNALPTAVLNVAQPWPYSLDPSQAFALFYWNSQCRAQHHYTFTLRVTDLLRVQILKNDCWCDTVQNIREYIEGPTKISRPELWGKYVYLSDAELNYYTDMPQRDIYYTDVIAIDSKNPAKYGTVVSEDITTDRPCLAIFWVAENLKAAQLHNFSNYSTNTTDLYNGWDPIRTTTLKYANGSCRFKNMPSDHFNLAESRRHFISSPCEPGYHAHSYCWNSETCPDIGMVLTGKFAAQLSCNITNGDIFSNKTHVDTTEITEDTDNDDTDPEDESVSEITSKIEDIDSKNTDLFTLHIRLLVQRKLSIVKDLETNSYIPKLDPIL